MAKVFAATQEQAAELDAEAEFVNHAVCPTCDAVLAHAEVPFDGLRGTQPQVVDDYTIGCSHSYDEDGNLSGEAEEVTPVWSAI